MYFPVSTIRKTAIITSFLLLASLASAHTTRRKGTPKSHSAKSVSAHKSAKSSTSRSPRSRHSKRVKARGQQAIQQDRAREIQEALIREKYMDGEPSGTWDQRTKDAMARYQSDHGWQTKMLPDSRALISLGLGPDHSQVLNPETAVTSPLLPASEPVAARGSANRQ